MDTEQAKDAAINSLCCQLELAAGYIRHYIDGGTNDDFMLRFADACDEMRANVSAEKTLEIFEALNELEGICRGYFNSMHARGERPREFEHGVKEALERVAMAKYGTTAVLGWKTESGQSIPAHNVDIGTVQYFGNHEEFEPHRDELIGAINGTIQEFFEKSGARGMISFWIKNENQI